MNIAWIFKALKKRIKNIVNTKKGARFWRIFAVIAIIVLAGVGLTNSLGNDVTKIIEKEHENEVLRKNELDEAMTQIRQNNQLGAVGWQTVYSNHNKIAIYNYTHLLAIDVSKGKESLYGAIDLKELGTNYIQGYVITCFSFCPIGEHVVINNAGTSSSPENATKYMYLCAVRSGSVKIIGQEDYHNIVDAWSDNGSYYAYAKKDGEEIYIYNVVENTARSLNFGYGTTIDQIYVFDNGDILVGTEELYILKKNKKYKPQLLNIEGKAIGLLGDSFFYYSNKSIYKYSASQTEHITDITGNFTINRINNNKVLFTDDHAKQVVAFDISANRLYSYNIPDDDYHNVHSSSFSPDLTKCIVPGFVNDDDITETPVSIIEPNGNKSTIFIEDLGLLGDTFYSWMDNNNLVKATHLDLSSGLGDFQIIKLNLENGETVIIWDNAIR